VREIPTDTCVSTGATRSGHESAHSAVIGAITSPVARLHRSRASSPRACAAGPSITHMTSCLGAGMTPVGSHRRGSPEKCSSVSQRSVEMSPPPQKAIWLSITTTF